MTSGSVLSDSERTLQRVHRGCLAALALCAAVIAGFAERESNAPPGGSFAYLAIAFGIGAILCRQQAGSARRSERSRLGLLISCFGFAAAIGGTGVALVIVEGQRQTGLLYTLAGAILALRPPGPSPARSTLRQPTGKDEP